MVIRVATAWAILAAFIALAVLAFFGDRLLAGIFVVVAGAVLVRHAVSLCPRCSNFHCAFNPRRAEVPRAIRHGDDAAEEAFSDLHITLTTLVPLLLAGPLAFIAAWRFNPVAAVIVGVVALSAHTVFQKTTCSHCGNDCAGNCNARYREWKHAGKPQRTA